MKISLYCSVILCLQIEPVHCSDGMDGWEDVGQLMGKEVRHKRPPEELKFLAINPKTLNFPQLE